VVGPVAWCALEHLAASPPVGQGDEDTVAASVRSLAAALGVSKHTAHRALVVLRAAGLVVQMQSRCASGRFDAGVYRLAIPVAVAARVDVGVDAPLGSADVGGGKCAAAAASSAAVPLSGPGRARRSRRGPGVEQLSLLPVV
jgi:hypothetical protein